MKNLGKKLLQKEPFSEVLMGNSALVRAMIESGTQVITSYPGSPTPEIAETIRLIPKEERPFYFEFSTNEKVATEVACGASLNGFSSAVFFKSVGINVAADTFVQLSLFELIGGMVIILGDDPGANSSQNEQDNRHFARLSYMPIFEPANPKEAYAMYKEAMNISREKKMPVILRLTTHVCHAKSKVEFEALCDLNLTKTANFDPKNGPYIPITSKALELKVRALKKIESFKEYSEHSPFNFIIKNNSPKGVITTGLVRLSLLDVINDAKYSPDILNLGIVHPLPSKMIVEFLKSHKEVKILEELDDFLEVQIKALAYEHKLDVKIIGKENQNDWIGEYTAQKVRSIISALWPDMIAVKEKRESAVKVPQRPAQMCPGCGHRSAFFAIKRALKNDDITVADIGCHTLGFLPPYSMGQALLCMGASPALGAGLSLFNDQRKVVAFMGDSTFFHAGAASVINAIYNKHNLTLILMENGTTAMTGHQGHPGHGENFNGASEIISLDKIFAAYNIEAKRVDAYNQAELTRLVQAAVNLPGFKVIIASHPCMLKLTRDQRRSGKYILRQVAVDQTKCDQQLSCIEQFACPTFTKTDEGKIIVNTDLCIGDGSCLKTCPSKAITPPKKV